METTKQPASWYLAGLHFLTAGFAVPVLIGAAAFVLLYFVSFESIVLRLVISFVLAIFSTWLGVRYSARYIHETYRVDDAESIVVLSTIFLAVLSVIRLLFTITSADLSRIIYTFVQLAVVLALFYSLSRKHFAA